MLDEMGITINLERTHWSTKPHFYVQSKAERLGYIHRQSPRMKRLKKEPLLQNEKPIAADWEGVKRKRDRRREPKGKTTRNYQARRKLRVDNHESSQFRCTKGKAQTGIEIWPPVLQCIRHVHTVIHRQHPSWPVNSLLAAVFRRIIDI